LAEHDEYRGGAMAFDDSFARNHADSVGTPWVRVLEPAPVER
jgi:hypothetical protein